MKKLITSAVIQGFTVVVAQLNNRFTYTVTDKFNEELASGSSETEAGAFEQAAWHVDMQSSASGGTLFKGATEAMCFLAAEVREGARSIGEEGRLTTKLYPPVLAMEKQFDDFPVWAYVDTDIDGGILVTAGVGASRQEVAEMLRQMADEVLACDPVAAMDEPPVVEGQEPDDGKI